MYFQPDTLDSALDFLDTQNARILAGGTDFFPALGDRLPDFNIMDVSAIKALRSIKEEDGYWVIGALATWSDIVKANLPPAFDALKLAAREVGSIQIQNRATVAGNLCNASPAADGVPPLLTLDAEVRLASKSAQRDISLSGFILGNRKTALNADEMLTQIRIPARGAAGRSTFIKLGARKYLIISISMVAARIATDESNIIKDAAISVGSCSAVALRLNALENALAGKALSPDLADLVTEDHLGPLSPIDDVRATGKYRHLASREMVIRTLQTLAGNH